MNNKLKVALLVVLVACFSGISSAHSGRRDSNGGNLERGTSVYHCHTDDCVLPVVPGDGEDVVDPPDGPPAPAITIAGFVGHD